MEHKKIIFRAEGNSKIGLGHLYRIFALIQMLQDEFQCILLTKSKAEAEKISSNITIKSIPEKISLSQEITWIATHFPSSQYTLVLDGYQFDSQYQKEVKKNKYKLAYIDDMSSQHMYADIVINHAPHIKKSDYQAESYTKFALGAKYALLRPAFLVAANNKRVLQKIDTAFVCFGGADPYDFTLKATMALEQKFQKIHVVVGKAYLHKEILNVYSKSSSVFIYQNLNENELLKVMKQCNFAVVPSSTILYELCTVKMPVLTGYYVNNQKRFHEGLLQQGVVFGMGDISNFTVGDFKKHIDQSLDIDLCKQLIDSQSKLIDGAVQKRFIQLFSEVQYRKARASDLMLLYNWANDPISRANSFQTAQISLETHNKWFHEKLSDKNSLIFIAEVNNIPAAVVKFEMSLKFSVIGINIASEFRGKGWASKFARDISELYFEKHQNSILAYVKKENVISSKIFKNAGYQQAESIQDVNEQSVVYQLQKPIK